MSTGRLDPVTLQVLVGALRSACDEMGAVLIRAAHSANIKERHDCSTALFDPAGELVMQAEHIPVHLGSMPTRCSRCSTRSRSRDGNGSSTTPTGAGPISRHHPDRAGVRGRAAARVRGQPRPPRRHRRTDPGGHARRLAAPRRRGRRHPPTPIHGSRSRGVRGAHARLGSGSPTCSPSARRTWSASRMHEIAARRGLDRLRDGMREILDYAERRTRAALAELPDGRYEANDVLEDDLRDADVSLHVAAVLEGDRLVLDFSGTDPQVDGNPELSALGDQIGVVLRRPGADRSRRALSAGAHRLIEVRARRCLLNAGSPAAVAAGTSRRRAAPPTSCSRHSVRRRAPRTGSGDDEQPHPRGGGIHVLRDDGGRPGRAPRRRRPSAIHVAMSNTPTTPSRRSRASFLVRVRELSVRRGSGGAGRYRAATAWSASSRRSSRCASA